MTTVLLCVAFALGVMLERRREGGSVELRDQLRATRAELRRVRHELQARRQASMSRHPSALPAQRAAVLPAPRSLSPHSASSTPSLHLVAGGLPDGDR